jgi:hypothetical protein
MSVHELGVMIALHMMSADHELNVVHGVHEIDLMDAVSL